MDKGTAWIGNYSRVTEPDGNDILVLKEQGKPWLDDEINASQDMLIKRLRKTLMLFIPDGSSDDGFKIVGTGANNNFNILVGSLHVKGWVVEVGTATTYSGQPVTPLSLTTPVANRVDIVYAEIHYAEINGTQDPAIIDPVIGARTSCRLRLVWTVKVAEGLSVPSDGLDESNVYRWRLPLARIARLAGNAAITSGMVSDIRAKISSASLMARGARELVGTDTFLWSDYQLWLAPAEGTTVNYYLPVYGDVSSDKTFKVRNVGQGVAFVTTSDSTTLDGETGLEYNPGDKGEISKYNNNWLTTI